LWHRRYMAHRAGTPRGRGKSATVYQGDTVTAINRHGETVKGTIASFGGGRHQTTVVRDAAGYTHFAETRDVEKAGS